MSSEKLPAWYELSPGAVIREPMSLLREKTHDWRLQKPVIDQDKCVRCRLCWTYCPEGAIKEVDKEYTNSKGRKFSVSYEIDYDHCKGCGVCAEECPVKAIKMIPEEE